MLSRVAFLMFAASLVGCSLDPMGTLAGPVGTGGTSGKGGSAGHGGLAGQGGGGLGGTAGKGGTGGEGGVGGTGGTGAGGTGGTIKDGGPEADAPFPTCNDGEKNGKETDIDCGGSCLPCIIGNGCDIGADCQTGVCVANVCSAQSCIDGLKDQDETDIDCGGAKCNPCGAGKGCKGDDDCSPNFCVAMVCTLPVSCADIKTRAPSSTSGPYTIDPPGGAGPVSVVCEMTADGGGWTQLLQCLPSDGCIAGGSFLYAADWLAADLGSMGASSYAIGKSLAPLAQTGVHFMIEVSNGNNTASVVYPLDAETRKFFAGGAYFSSLGLSTGIVDSDNGYSARSLKICSAPNAASHPRSLQGPARLGFLGNTTGTPNAAPDGACSFGSLDSQMLLQDANLTASWGAPLASSWIAQPYSHKLFVREAAPTPISIVAVGAGRVWSDGAIGRTCADYRNAASGARTYSGLTGTGVYTIKPDPAKPAFEVLCEMDTDGGGWTLIQRTVWDWTLSSALMTGFDDFYSKFAGNLGDAWRMPGSMWPEVFARGDMLSVNYPRKAVGGADCGPLFHKGTGGSIGLSQAAKSLAISGMVSNAALLNWVTNLSCTDSGPSPSCVNAAQGIPWFYGGCCAICPTLKGSYWVDAPHPSVSWIHDTPDLFGKIDTNVCGSDTPTNSGTFVAVNTMEFYFR